jgi:CysZ protein
VSAPGFLGGVGVVPEALRLLRRERRLRGPALVPLAISVVALLGATAALVAFAPELYGWLTATLPDVRADAWWEWLWVGPLRLLRAAAGAVFFAIVAAASLAAALALAGVLASPFHDVLSLRTERVESGAIVDLAPGGLRETLRSAAADAGRLAIFFAIQGAILVAGLVVPGGQIVVGPVLMLVTAFFLPLEYASFALDRRALGLRGKLAWIRRHRAAAVGFGAAALALCAVPIVNLAALPVLVVAGTLLVVRIERGEPPSTS